MCPLYGRDSTASRLEPLPGGKLLYTTKFPEIPGTYFINLRWKVELTLETPCVVLNMGPLDWESNTLTIRSLHNSTSIVRPVKRNQLSFSSNEINKPLAAQVHSVS